MKKQKVVPHPWHNRYIQFKSAKRRVISGLDVIIVWECLVFEIDEKKRIEVFYVESSTIILKEGSKSLEKGKHSHSNTKTEKRTI